MTEQEERWIVWISPTSGKLSPFNQDASGWDRIKVVPEARALTAESRVQELEEEVERLQRRRNDAEFAKDAALAASREMRKALGELRTALAEHIAELTRASELEWGDDFDAAIAAARSKLEEALGQ